MWVGLQADGFRCIEAEGVGLKPDPRGVARICGSAFRPTGFADAPSKTPRSMTGALCVVGA